MLSLRYVCVFNVRASSSPPGYPCTKFHFCCTFRCWARLWRKITYSFTHSLNQSINHAAYLMCQEPRLLLLKRHGVGLVWHAISRREVRLGTAAGQFQRTVWGQRSVPLADSYQDVGMWPVTWGKWRRICHGTAENGQDGSGQWCHTPLSCRHAQPPSKAMSARHGFTVRCH